MRVPGFKLPAAILAPLAGVTDASFRKIAAQLGASATVTEMVSARALRYGDAKTMTLMRVDPEEKMVGLQLFGHDPEDFAFALDRIDCTPFAFIDLNCGCPAPKIVKNGDGSALMKNPSEVGRIVRTLVSGTTLPVTVKMRLGFDEGHKNFVEVAKICEDAGASAVTLHARTRAAMYAGTADWDAIRTLAEAITIPVVGNGDIVTAEDALARMQTYGVEHVMIGRGAMGNPWIFKEIEELREGREVLEPTLEERYLTIVAHYRETLRNRGLRVGIPEMRKHVHAYLKGLHGATKVRVAINETTDPEEIACILYDYFSALGARNLEKCAILDIIGE